MAGAGATTARECSFRKTHLTGSVRPTIIHTTMAPTVAVSSSSETPVLGRRDSGAGARNVRGSSFSGNVTGPCPAGGTHDGSQSGPYGVLWEAMARAEEVTYQQADGVTVDNGNYRAHSGPSTGALDLIELKSGSNLTTLLDEERFQIPNRAGHFTESNLGEIRFVIPEATTSYGNRLYPNPYILRSLPNRPSTGHTFGCAESMSLRKASTSMST